MILFISIVIVAMATGILIIRYALLKRQMKDILRQMERDDTHPEYIHINLFDRDLEALTLRINKRTDAYDRMAMEKEESSRVLKSSIADISHDMRTPLTSIVGYLQLLARTKLSAEQKQYADRVLAKSQYLRMLLTDFFSFALLDTNDTEVELKKVDLAGVVSETILNNADEFERHHMMPDFAQSDQAVFVRGDAGMLERVIQNLITNCLKYSCGTVTFRIDVGDSVILTIQNPAKDIARIDPEQIFERFYRADNARGGQGTGLGLAIAKLLVEKMQGKITASVDADILKIHIELASAMQEGEQ